MNSESPTPEGSPVGLLLSRDLMFTSRVTSEARALGARVMTAGNPTLATSMIEQWQPRVVFVDLSAGELVTPAAILAYRAASTATFIAFGSHVDRAGLDAARDAGCNLVLFRSQFHSQLPDLIRQYLAPTTTAAEQESNKS